MMSNFYKSEFDENTKQKLKFAILIPGYKEDKVILEVAKMAIQQNYPAEKFIVIVIADSFKKSTVEQLAKMNLITEIVSFEKSTKVKALNTVLARIGQQHDYDNAVILDADNVMESGFLEKMNTIHQKGYRAIQGKRAAKNDVSSLAFLDGLSEDINNNIYGKGSVVLNCSASLKGSGMSFDFELLRSELAKMDSIGGFDRELELRLVKQGVRVYFADNAVVRDEKVEKREVFENQRRRWISSQYHYLRAYFWEGLQAGLKGNFALFNSIFLRNLQLPRLLNIGLVNVLLISSLFLYFYRPILNLDIWYYIIVTLLVDIGVLLAISKEYLSVRLLKSIVVLPGIFFKMLLLMFKLKGANKKFIHTPHGSESENQA